jgi:opacity protein-like surface antigen
MDARNVTMKRTVALLVAALVLAGCAQVQPWEKGNLAKPEMSFESDPLQARFEQHIFFSKENASGGYGVGGGGCGCN